MKKVIFLGLTLVLAITATAQSHVINAYEALKQDRCATVQRISNSFDKDGKRTGQLEAYAFDASGSHHAEQLVKDLIEAFNTDSDQAYSYVNVTRDKKTTAQRYAIHYDDAGNTVVIGKDVKYNYTILSAMDKDDNTKTMRYCYAIEWRKHKDDGHLSGRVIKAYAPKPSSNLKKVVVRVGDKEWSGDDLSDLTPETIKSMRVFKGVPDSIMIELKDLIPDSLEHKLDVLGNRLGVGTDLSKTFKGLEKQLEGFNLNGNAVTLKVVGTNDDIDPTDDVEWLTSFNHYRNAFKRAAQRKSSSASSYAASVLRLCKNARQASLTDGEIRLCCKSITEMQKLTDDDFVRGLLDEAIKYLK
ncbi:MAG: hypothetical protein IJ808_09630 [Muribaculaceae bacterium]|nr:hypothetical protein [Muribaculaceae bacterium]